MSSCLPSLGVVKGTGDVTYAVSMAKHSTFWIGRASKELKQLTPNGYCGACCQLQSLLLVHYQRVVYGHDVQK